MGSKSLNKRYYWLLKAVTEHNSNECLMWPFQVDKDGYGRLRPLFEGKRITVGAHRLAFKIANGKWPKPFGCHTCDKPGCVNPRHIFEGTCADNHADQVSKGRSIKGVMQHDAKMTDETVMEARKEYAKGKLGFYSLSKKFGVTALAMKWAITGKTWKHVPGSVEVIHKKREKKEFCGKGHALTKENLYIYGNFRQCKKCTAERSKRRKA